MEFDIRTIQFNSFEPVPGNNPIVNDFNLLDNVSNKLSFGQNHNGQHYFLLNQEMNNNLEQENFDYFYEQILNEDLNNNDHFLNYSSKPSEFNSIDKNYQSVAQNNQSQSTSSNLTMEQKKSDQNFPQELKYYPFVIDKNLSETNIADYQLVPMVAKTFICHWIGCTRNIFSTLKDLVIHIEYCHIDQQRYSGENFICHWTNCNRNGKPFDQRYKLINHMRTHSGDKPKKCPMFGCEKVFSRQENLKIHIRSHTNDKPYRCLIDDCKKAFSNSSDRAKHRRTHFSAKPWACQFPNCNKRYTDPSSLRKHRKQQHHHLQASNRNNINNNQCMDALSKSWPVNMNKQIQSNLFNLEKTWSNSIFNDFLNNKQAKTVDNSSSNYFNQNNLEFNGQTSSNIDVNPTITVDESTLNFKTNFTYQQSTSQSGIVFSIKNNLPNQERQIYSTDGHQENVLMDWFEYI